MSALHFFLEKMDTPIGVMLIITDEEGRLRALDWLDEQNRMHQLMCQQYRGHTVTLQETSLLSPSAQAMQAYFSGNIAVIDQLEVATGGTDFQRQVWVALRTIPHGKTISYRELAIRIGSPKAMRAVGMANGANPVSIVLPCHRVIGSNQSLTGYGGGLYRKRWLLEHEKAIAPQRATPETGMLPGL